MGWFKKARSKLKKVSPTGQAHSLYKEQYDKATGKNEAKDAKREQLALGQVIDRQQQAEQLRLAEASSDVNKRKLKSGSGYGLMRALR
jgi:hypothetical protein